MLGKIGKWYSEIFLYKGSLRLSILARVALVVAMLVNLIMVIVRKLFVLLGWKMGGAIVGGYEVTQVAMVFMTTCAFCLTWYTAGHIRVGLIRDRMKERSKAAMDAFYAFIAVLYIAVVVWGVFLQAKNYLAIGSYTQLIHIPVGPLTVIFCIVMAHAFLVLLRSFIGLVSKALGKKFASEPYLEGQ